VYNETALDVAFDQEVNPTNGEYVHAILPAGDAMFVAGAAAYCFGNDRLRRR
jgi:hypothetical protein